MNPKLLRNDVMLQTHALLQQVPLECRRNIVRWLAWCCEPPEEQTPPADCPPLPIDRLPEPTRQIIQLVLTHPRQTVADRLGITLAEVQQHIVSGVSRLKKEIEA